MPRDPYRSSWVGRPIAEVLREIGGLPLYERIYRQNSGWIHWSPGAIGTAVKRNQDGVVYTEVDPENSATAVAVGFQALFQSVSELDTHFERGFADRLAELRDDYVAELGAS